MKKFIKTVVALFFTLLFFVVVGAGIYVFSLYTQVKDIAQEKVNVDILALPTKVFSSDGKLIASFGLQNRIPVKLNGVSIAARHAVLAAEDANFYEHGAIDILGILRAFLTDVVHRKFVEGGSTITQQLIKNIYLSPSKTISRKIKEIILSYELEKRYSKDKILQMYLNTVYFGSGAWGIESAARTYFDKNAKDLNIAEGALLAGLIKAPSAYNPYKHPHRAKIRMIYVLNRMLKNNFINRNQYAKAMHSRIVLKKQGPNIFGILMAPYFTDYIRSYLINKYGEDVIYKSGFKVYTTLDMHLQRYAFIAVKKGVLRLSRGRYRGLQSALLAMDPKTGYVKAMIGGFDYKKSQFNRALQAERQPGSSFKPFVYLTALQEGYMPTDTIDDSPVVFRFNHREWRPENYSSKFHGTITLMYALVHSINVATIKLLNDVGVDNVISNAKKLGISEKIPRNLSIALGSFSVKLIEMVRAYAAFDNYGLLPKPIFITKITDRKNNVIYQDKPHLERKFSELNGFILNGMLKNVINYGTGRRAKILHRPLAGKTGTTNGFRDAWFIGYSPHLVAGVWVGYDNDKTIFKGAEGARAALPIWIDFMSNALKDKPIGIFPVPKGVTDDVLQMLSKPPEPESVNTKPNIQNLYDNIIN